ncbi:hypothetical protein IE81DRAFT_287884 [Ceraceosorus guamensis]|uniref:Carbamoyl phosphate synthase ATP-binding domain-containing protein n=1 Tax=Ceraceosorus guamensis TaxID=1522189 RepID=A0A316W2K3_9BASI|nr:hypothetical protein IE81DRAFT_287884 [Ceraceosorus guamensis]PWN43919.1 hypothetical protein IE81DRAFT_287884 [Ceraceosorus guamensis]
MSRLRPPQGVLTCFCLVALSLCLAPLTIAQCVFVYLRTQHRSNGDAAQARRSAGRNGREDASQGPIALVNGGKMQKALYVVRALHRQGYRVVLVEERGWGELCATRFSNSVHRFELVPGGGGQAYIDALVDLAIRLNAKLFIPCSGAGTTIEDAKAAELMRARGKVRTLIQDADLAEALHEKDRFVDLVHELGLQAPTSTMLHTPDEALAHLRAQDASRGGVLLKAATVLDDVGRSDMTTYPLQDCDGQVDWEATERKIKSGLSIPLSKDTPYVAQEFIGGENASEWCTHATVWNGTITAFVCCPSNDLLMTYHDATHARIGQLTLQWTRDFLARLSSHPKWSFTRLTGQFSMDFIYQPARQRLVVIECNPRVHTAICLLRERKELGRALDGAQDELVVPTEGTRTVSWVGHDIFARLLPSVLSRSIVEHLYGSAGLQSSAPTRFVPSNKDQRGHADRSYDLEQVGLDGAWDEEDPLTYFALYHIQWPALLLRQALLRRKAFSRINVSTARIFEC